MKTPDSKEFHQSDAALAVKSAASGLAAAAKSLASSLWKLTITTWRLAAALDSALWRALKLVSRKAARAMHFVANAIGVAIAGVVAWLPTRWGRAYSAAFGILAIISGLWGVDQIRTAANSQSLGDTDLRAPIDRDDPILARIDGRYVHLSEIASAARASGFLKPEESLTVESAFERKLVETYVEQRLLARAAQDTGLHRAPDVLRKVNAARDRVLAAAFVESQTDRAVTPESVERLYDRQKDVTVLGDEIQARHILVATEAEAIELFALLQGGADFRALAAERSIDPGNAKLGGEIGWFTRDMMPPAFARAVFAAAPGTVTMPFETEFGWHVVEVRDRRATRPISFVEVSDQIETYLRMRTIERSLDNLERDRQVVYFRPENNVMSIQSELPPPDLTEEPAPLEDG